MRRGLDHAGDADWSPYTTACGRVGREVILRAVRDAQAYGAVIPVVAPVDSLRRIADGGSNIVDRLAFRIVQTPQVFHTEILRKAYRDSLFGTLLPTMRACRGGRRTDISLRRVLI